MIFTDRRSIRIVTFTTLYPNATLPTHGVFVENRLRHLVADGRVTSRVIAPVPWIPRALAKLVPGRAVFAQIPPRESRHGLPVAHPRFFVLPKIGMTLAPFLLFARSLSATRQLAADGSDFDLIDAHYFYPDGVAAILLGKVLNKPVVITARGSDINLIAKFTLPRRMIRFAANRAMGVVAVSQALKNALIDVGVPASKIHVLRNGVDLDTFCPQDRRRVRAQMRIEGPALLSVGQLVELKAHDLIIGALPDLPGYTLLIVGDGPERSKLERLAKGLKIANRVRFLGPIPHERLAEIYSVADALVLASSREGWPNVLLEAMACGTPVIGSKVGGIPEIVNSPAAGVLISERTSAGIAAAVKHLFQNPPDRAATRRYAEQFSWDATTDGQIRLFDDILARINAARLVAPKA